MSALKRLSDVSTPRQVLIRLCQSICFGQIRDLYIRRHEPVFDPPPIVMLDFKLDGDLRPRLEAELPDFQLRDEIVRLLDRIDAVEEGRLDLIVIQAGIPRRVVIERRLTEAPL